MSLKIIENQWGDFRKHVCKSKETGCAVCPSLNHEHIILNSENINSKIKISNNMSDCVFVEQRKILYVGIIEIKGRSFGVTHVRLQLEGGIELAKHVLKKSNIRHHKIFPILVAKNFRDGVKAQMIKNCPVVINGKKIRISLATCGQRFSDIVPDD